MKLIRRIGAFARRKWFWMPLVLACLTLACSGGWTYWKFRKRVAALKTIDAPESGLSWHQVQRGPEFLREYFAYSNRGGPQHGPLDTIETVSPREGWFCLRPAVTRNDIAQLTALTELKSLNLMIVATDDMFPAIAKLKALRVLNIGYSQDITGAGFSALSQLPYLEKINFEQCPVWPQHFMSLRHCRSLKEIKLTYWLFLNPECLDRFSRARPDVKLVIQHLDSWQPIYLTPEEFMSLQRTANVNPHFPGASVNPGWFCPMKFARRILFFFRRKRHWIPFGLACVVVACSWLWTYWQFRERVASLKTID